jgi:hypothetical protein
MKEYKFRGFDSIGNKGWVYGDLVHNQKVTATGLESRVMVGGYEVVPESVGVCTGLKDKKDNNIYEGDVVQFNENLKGVVTYLNDFGLFIVVYDEFTLNWTDFSEFKCYECEIVGNAFDMKKNWNNG